MAAEWTGTHLLGTTDPKGHAENLRGGTILTKFAMSSGKAQVRFFKVSRDGHELQWGDPKGAGKMPGRLDLSKVQRLAAGFSSRSKVAAKDDQFAFSLVSDDRSLDLQAHNLGDFNMWYRGLQYLVYAAQHASAAGHEAAMGVQREKLAGVEKELAAFAKKQAQRDKVWQQGAKDTSKQEEAAQKAVADKHSKALELAAKLNGGDSSWFVKVLAEAKQIEAMPAVRCRSQALAFPLPKKPASGGAERAAWCAGCARRERRGRLLHVHQARF